MIAAEGGLNELAGMCPGQKSDLFRKLGVVRKLQTAGHGEKGAIVATHARLLGVSKQAVAVWQTAFEKHGFRGLVDGRRGVCKGRAALPQVTRNWIADKILRVQREDGILEVHRQVIDQWRLWQRTGDPQWALPGYDTCPPDCGKGHPAGMSYETFLRCKPTNWQAQLSRQGTIASYRNLPSILSTRVGSKYLETIFFDDQKYDVQVRVPGYDKPMVPLGFNALDRLTAYPFFPHIRLRWYDESAEVNRSLTQKEFVWYMIAILCREGYRTDDAGTTLIQEHGTAKAWSNKALATPNGYSSFEEAVAALTGGHVLMDDSGLFNKPAFAEMLYGPQSSGNPRFKAPIESFFHIVRTYMLPMIGQTGRNVEMAPEETYGIDQYERAMAKAAKSLPERMREAILSNYLTGVEFGHMAHLVYDALANRPDHALEGWAACNFVEPVWRWEEDPVDLWRSRGELAGLPPHLREHALSQQARNPRLSTIQPWSPAVARLNCQQDPAIRKLAFTDAIHLLPTTWAKHATLRSRHELHLTDDLLPGQELVYLPELTNPNGRTEYLQPGDEVMVYLNPLMPETLLCCDMEHKFIGTLTRNVRIGHDNNQLEEMFRQRARLKGAMEGRVRAAMQPVADRRLAVRELNADLIEAAEDVRLGRPAMPAAIRDADALQAERQAAAGRLQAAGNAGPDTDFDSAPACAPADPFAGLADDEDEFFEVL